VNGWGQVLSSPCGTSQDLILPFLDPAVSAPPSRRAISQDLTPFAQASAADTHAELPDYANENYRTDDDERYDDTHHFSHGFSHG